MNVFETITAIPAITIIVLMVAQAVKSWVPVDNKHIPAICGLLGGALGAICFFYVPGMLPADNVVVAVAIGAVSGWGATGVHQAVKQYTEKED